MPQVSVIMSVYEDQQYIEKAIESILNQEFSDFEFVIIDDCGGDDTAQIVSRYAIDDARIHLLRNEENQGLTRSLNRGFAHATGKYLARMDADDVSHPERLRQQVAFMEAHPEVGVLGTFHRYTNEDTVKVSPVDHEAIVARLLFTNVFCHPSVMLRKDVVEKHQLFYDESFYYSQDYELWVRAMAVTQLAVLPVNLVDYRVHPGQISTQKRTKQREFLRQVWAAYFAIFGVVPGRNVLAAHEKLINRHPMDSQSFFQLVKAYQALVDQSKAVMSVQTMIEKEIDKVLGGYLDHVAMRWPKGLIFTWITRMF